MSWTLDDIPWQDFDPAKVNPEVLKIIKAAALVERNGADYGQYLSKFLPMTRCSNPLLPPGRKKRSSTASRWAGGRT
ncbi:MAG: hypothetical protein ACPHGY_02470 [Rhodospirillaceae bacterium]